MKFIAKGAITLLSTALLVGCATITKGTKDTVRFESSPSGASLHVVTNTADDAKNGPYGCIVRLQS